MSDVPWVLVGWAVTLVVALISAIQFEFHELFYVSLGGICGLSIGIVESLQWASRIDRKYKTKETSKEPKV